MSEFSVSSVGLLLLLMGFFSPCTLPTSLQDHSPAISSWEIPDPLGNAVAFKKRKLKLDL